MRDVIFYSLSYDADVMPQAALSARQMDTEHIQGMLNVAFTRARDEIHVFHSTPVSGFGMASGKGAIRDWLEHCEKAGRSGEQDGPDLTATDSEFEAEVIQALLARGVEVKSQYPSCGYRLDILAELHGRRLVIECDGEPYHTDEHGVLRIEDVERQEVLERAGWHVERIPYRKWRENPRAEVERMMAALAETDEDEPPAPTVAQTANNGLSVGAYEAAIIQALQEGHSDRGPLYRAARQHLGFKRLGSNIEFSLDQAVASLERRGLVHEEDGELFLAQDGRAATVVVPNLSAARSAPSTSYGGRRRRRRRRRRY